MNVVIVKEKYQRMKFDISFDIIESQNDNVMGLYAPLVNLLCYTVVLNGVEIKSLFTCCGLQLIDEKKLALLGTSAKDKHSSKELQSVKSMILGVEHLNKQSNLTVW